METDNLEIGLIRMLISFNNLLALSHSALKVDAVALRAPLFDTQDV